MEEKYAKNFDEFIRLHEAKLTTDNFELTDCENLTRSRAEKIIKRRFPDNIEYNGIKFTDDIYLNIIVPAAEKEIRQIISSGKAQEVYLGYLPNDDLFISGWDLFEDGSSIDYVVIKINNMKAEIKNNYNLYRQDELFYDGGGSYEQLHKKFKDLVDIRLD